MFDETHSNAGRLTNEYNIIRNQFGIDWSTVTWSDLRKPLYSGISAALYIILHGGTEWRIEDQAHFYELHFVNKAGNNFTNEASILDQGIKFIHSIDKFVAQTTIHLLFGYSTLRSDNFPVIQLIV